jgi:hypothetical protein
MTFTNGPPEAPVVDPLAFSASDVTGTNELEFSGIDGYRLASDVAMSVAEAMGLPTNVPWALRDDASARMLEERAVGSQVQTGARLVVLPKSHLG